MSESLVATDWGIARIGNQWNWCNQGNRWFRNGVVVFCLDWVGGVGYSVWYDMNNLYKQLRMIQVWVDIHKEELLADWELAVSGEEPFRIEPLR